MHCNIFLQFFTFIYYNESPQGHARLLSLVLTGFDESY
jgi:hypothetical protein